MNQSVKQRGVLGVAVCTLLILGALAFVFLTASNTEEALRSGVRLTARTSFLLFLTAFIASAMNRLWPSPAMSALVRNRRYVGLSFASSHIIHAALFLGLAALSAELQAEVLTRQMLIFGGVGYFFILSMAFTSTDGMQSLLGIRRWKLLHTIGGYYIWFQFMVSFGKRVPQHPLYYLPIVLLLIALGLKLAGRLRQHRLHAQHASTTM